MNQYVTGSVIRSLREKSGLTQEQLAEKINVSSKAVSKWETGRGFPDISFLDSLARVLGVSIIELLSGNPVCNTNRCANIRSSQFYVCPVCGNVIYSVGRAVISCCGIVLPEQKAEKADDGHAMGIEISEDEYFVSVNHEMTREHHISFIACLRSNGIEIVKMYPEQNAQCRFKISGAMKIFSYCNRDGLFELKI